MKYISNILSLSSRWEMSASRFSLLSSLLNTIIFNGVLYSYLASNLDLYSISGILIAASIVVIAFIINLLFISLIIIIAPAVIKPFFVITALINSVAIYYMVTYQVVLDITMMGNILNTRSSESVELLTPTLGIYIFVLGVIPGFLFLKLKINSFNKLKTFSNLVIVIILGVFVLYLNASSSLWIDKHSKLLGGKILPWSYIINTVRHYSNILQSSKKQILLPDGKFVNNKKMAVVLIIGETARAHNFSLYGYPRKTNPRLQSEDILTFNKTTSCTTYTTGSVACMLSHDVSKSGYEPLPSYLARLGVDVVWRTNNWGEPPLHVTKYQTASELRKKCHGDGCNFDEVLLTGIKEEIQSSDKQKVFIVLHTKGSHGPSYYSRYPSEFEKFTPVCRYEEISKCTQEELINAYDNTIIYTDYFLYKAIKELEKLNNIPVTLIYISDHGESLGEKGLYLHGMPSMFAPELQKEIPFIIWSSQKIENKKSNQLGEFSHSNVFHTIVGALNLETKVYNSNLDVLHKTKSVYKMFEGAN